MSAKRWADANSGGFEMTTMTAPKGKEMWRPKKPGRYLIDVIPFQAGAGNPMADEGEWYFERTFWAHRGIGAEKNSYCCPAKTFGKKCPICEEQARQERLGGSEDLIKSLKPKKRQLWNVFVHSEEDKGVQLWEVSFYNFGELLSTEVNADEDDEEGLGDFANPDEGKRLRILLKEKSFSGQTFLETASISFKDRKPLSDELMEEAVCLDDLLTEKSYKELKEILFQTEPEEEEDDEDEPVRRRKKKPSKPEPEEEDEEDEWEDDEELEEDEDDWEDEEEDEEPPKRKAKKAKKATKGTKKATKKKKPEPEEEEDEEWEDEEALEEDDDEELEEDEDEEWEDEEWEDED